MTCQTYYKIALTCLEGQNTTHDRTVCTQTLVFVLCCVWQYNTRRHLMYMTRYATCSRVTGGGGCFDKEVCVRVESSSTAQTKLRIIELPFVRVCHARCGRTAARCTSDHLDGRSTGHREGPWVQHADSGVHSMLWHAWRAAGAWFLRESRGGTCVICFAPATAYLE